MSRKVTAGLFMSVDGVAEAPNLFQGDSFDDAMGEFMGATTDAVLGRVGFTEWSGYFPGAGSDDPFAAFINPLRKHVASTTLTPETLPEWPNSTLIVGDAVEYVRALKENGAEGEIAVMGGIGIVRSMFFGGVLDEVQLMIHPVIAGSGRHLFQDGDPQTRLTLVKSVVTSRGNALLTYGRRDA